VGQLFTGAFSPRSSGFWRILASIRYRIFGRRVNCPSDSPGI
ncbi:uncharacterized protein METZ01_LOCUS289838, partial [marine metagenome]